MDGLRADQLQNSGSTEVAKVFVASSMSQPHPASTRCRLAAVESCQL